MKIVKVSAILVVVFGMGLCMAPKASADANFGLLDKWPDVYPFVAENFDGLRSYPKDHGSASQGELLEYWPGTWNASPSYPTFEGWSTGGYAKTRAERWRRTHNLTVDATDQIPLIGGGAHLGTMDTIADFGTGNEGIGHGNYINGTDANPLLLQFWCEFKHHSRSRWEAYGASSNFYMELSADGDQAPRQGMVESDVAPPQTPYAGKQWTDGTLRQVLAYGSFAACNKSGADGASGNYGGFGSQMYYDGLIWHYKDLGAMWKHAAGKTTVFTAEVRTNVVVLWMSSTDGSNRYGQMVIVPRLYRGPFNELSMTMGNIQGRGNTKNNNLDYITMAGGEVSIAADVLPNDCPNLFTVNLQGKGRLPVAIFPPDASAVDLDSISIGGVVFPVKVSVEDKRTPVAGAACGECASTEVPDGQDEIIAHFSRRELIEALGLDLMDPGEVVTLSISANQTAGPALVAADCIELVARED